MRPRHTLQPLFFGIAVVASASACSSSKDTGSSSTDAGHGTDGGTTDASGGHNDAAAPDASDGSTSTGDATPGDGGAPGPQIAFVDGGSAAAPYQFGPNAFGITGSAFFAKAPMGSESVVLDTTKPGELCLKGTVDVVPTPADGGHPPYSTYWGVDLGFDLNDVLPTSDAGAGSDASGGDAGASDASRSDASSADASSADASGVDAAGSDAAAEAGAPTAVKSPWIVPSNVVGFWFTVQGSAIPSLRFKTTPTGKDPSLEQDSCAVVSATSGVPNAVPFTDTYVQCWDGPTGTAATDISQGLLDVSLQVAAGTDGPQDVDFCWTAFGVLTK